MTPFSSKPGKNKEYSDVGQKPQNNLTFNMSLTGVIPHTYHGCRIKKVYPNGDVCILVKKPNTRNKWEPIVVQMEDLIFRIGEEGSEGTVSTLQRFPIPMDEKGRVKVFKGQMSVSKDGERSFTKDSNAIHFGDAFYSDIGGKVSMVGDVDDFEDGDDKPDGTAKSAAGRRRRRRTQEIEEGDDDFD